MQTNHKKLCSQTVRHFPMFAGVDSQAIELICDNAQEVAYAAGENVIAQGDLVDATYWVIGGRLKIFLLSCTGHERIIRLVNDGGSFGEAIMFNDIRSPIFVQSLTPVRLMKIPQATMMEFMSNEPGALHHMLRGLSSILTELIADIEASCMQKASQRVAHYLSTLLSASAPPHHEVVLPASKKIVASMLNITPETFSRELHQLENKGMITISRRTIYIHDVDALHEEVNHNRPAWLPA